MCWKAHQSHKQLSRGHKDALVNFINIQKIDIQAKIVDHQLAFAQARYFAMIADFAIQQKLTNK